LPGADRNFTSKEAWPDRPLKRGVLPAQERGRLRLLPSGPDRVHGRSSQADSSAGTGL